MGITYTDKIKNLIIKIHTAILKFLENIKLKLYLSQVDQLLAILEH